MRELNEYAAKTSAVACVGPECDKPVWAKGVCPGHYQQLRHKGALSPLRVRLPPGPCIFPDCDNPRAARGYCGGHHLQIKQGRELQTLRVFRKADEIVARDEQGRKRCAGCDAFKPESDFTRNRRRPDGFMDKCKSCEPPNGGGNREYRIRVTYNISLAEFEEILRSQGGRCATCGTDSPGGNGWCIDHDHSCCGGPRSCGECVRGILCTHCNSALGYVRDNTQTLMNMVAYLDARK